MYVHIKQLSYRDSVLVRERICKWFDVSLHFLLFVGFESHSKRAACSMGDENVLWARLVYLKSCINMVDTPELAADSCC